MLKYTTQPRFFLQIIEIVSILMLGFPLFLFPSSAGAMAVCLLACLRLFGFSSVLGKGMSG